MRQSIPSGLPSVTWGGAIIDEDDFTSVALPDRRISTPMSHILRELIEAVLLALLVFFFIQISVQNFRVHGHSMQPTLDGGEYLMVSKLSYIRLDKQRLARLVPFWGVADKDESYLPFAHPPERGDVIVFHAPTDDDKDFVKRVIGLPGEKVEIRGGKIYIDGEVFNEPYLARSNLTRPMDCIPKLDSRGCRLLESQYFVLGDNRTSSNDSRNWGPVELESIVGKVWFVYWPFSEIPFVGSLAADR